MGCPYGCLYSRLFHSRRQHPSADRLQRSRRSVVALVRSGSFVDCHSVLCAAAHNVVAATCVERCLCGDQSLSIVAALYRASSRPTDERGGGNSPTCLRRITTS